MKRKNLLIILLALAIHAAGLETAKATCSMSPTANITTTPAALVFYTGESVQLSGETSVPNCGSINEYRWRVRPVGGEYTTLYQGSSSTYNHTFTLSSGVSEQGYNVELRVRQSNGVYHTRTIQVTVTRNNKSLYYLTDHLGSVRVTVNEAGDPVGWDDYYPFGLQMPGRTQNASNPNDDTKFTGYELEQQGGLGLYHAGARMYDPVIGRFMSVDPHAAIYPSLSPYVYVSNNPLRYIDPDGKEIRPANQAAFNAIRNTLSANDAKLVSLNAHGFIEISGSGSSSNFKHLVELVNDSRIIDFSISDSFPTLDGNGQKIDKPFGEFDYRTLSEFLLQEGYTSDMIAQIIESSGGDGILGGFAGITLTPNNGSPDNNIKAVINITLNNRDQVRTAAHELYGHVLSYIRGKPYLHSTNPNKPNRELEILIRKAIEEAERNYDDRNN
ncbi:MAG: RHS repeat-associated core domain-containing protein [Balneolaceae bacterium]|nr:MAG: RHS repeat-associated core domain-containing protein [Balneolaceae bacterium]